MIRSIYSHLILIFDPERLAAVRVLITLAVIGLWVYELIDFLFP